jgi:hypothetical protein
MDTLMFIYFYSNRCGLEVGSVLFHGHCSVGRRRDFLFPRTLCTQETLLHFSIRRHFYPFRYFISIGIILNFDRVNFDFLIFKSGLLLLLGLVVYVSVFTAEIGSKLRPSSSLQPPMFTYTYGYSFHLVVTGFLAGEVYHFIHLN